MLLLSRRFEWCTVQHARRTVPVLAAQNVAAENQEEYLAWGVSKKILRSFSREFTV